MCRVQLWLSQVVLAMAAATLYLIIVVDLNTVPRLADGLWNIWQRAEGNTDTMIKFSNWLNIPTY